MDDVATKIIEILKKHMKEPRDDINASTALTDLKIESLDLAMIVFDIEDALPQFNEFPPKGFWESISETTKRDV